MQSYDRERRNDKLSRPGFQSARVEVRSQLAAMGCPRFELGVLSDRDRMSLEQSLSAAEIEARLAALRRANAHGAHIFVRPQDLWRLTLVDDLDCRALNRMKREGFAPAAVVETSPENFQAWLKHGQSFPDREAATIAARVMAERFGGDRSSAAWRHFGRLAGFTNQKPNRRLSNGLPPFVRLREGSGRVFPKHAELRAEVLHLAEELRRARQAQARVSLRVDKVAGLAEFHRACRYQGDLHRADMAWALYAASQGLGVLEIAAAIRAARDLSKKGGAQRQRAYAERTARKAIFSLVTIRPDGSVERIGSVTL